MRAGHGRIPDGLHQPAALTGGFVGGASIMTTSNRWLLIAALSGLVAVIAGAYGAHGLDGEERLRDLFNNGVQYHMWHSLALFGIAWATGDRAGKEGAPGRAKWADRAGWLFLAGIVLFSGSLYFYGMTGSVPFSGSAPMGGYTLMAGWAVLAFAATRRD